MDYVDKGPHAQDYKDAVCRLLALTPQSRARSTSWLLPKLAVDSGAYGPQTLCQVLLAEMAGQGTIKNIGKPAKARCGLNE